MSHSLISTGHIFWELEVALHLGLGAITLRKCLERRMQFFVYKPKSSPKGIVMGWCHAVRLVFRNPSLSLTQVTQIVFFSTVPHFRLTVACDISCRTFCFPPVAFVGVSGGIKLGAWWHSRWTNVRGRRMSLFVYKPTASLRGIICIGARSGCPVLHNSSLSLMQVTQSAFFPFL